MIIEKEISIKLAPLEGGGIRAWSDELPGLILSHSDQIILLRGLGDAIIELRRAQMAEAFVRKTCPNLEGEERLAVLRKVIKVGESGYKASSFKRRKPSPDLKVQQHPTVSE